MKNQVEFSFDSDAVAKAYDAVLVPALFEPWAAKLISDNGPWGALTVLDLACGTGVVTKELVKNVGPKGRVIALDFNSQMLKLAELKCEEWQTNIDFIEGSADAMDILGNSIDKIVCQQGFQFFPDKKAAASEIYRVLKPKGKAILSTWRPVSECEIVCAICISLEIMNLNVISQMMRVPFDVLTEEELLNSFKDVGFSNIKISKQELPLFLKNGIDSAIAFAYATPIGPKLSALADDKQLEFANILMDKLQTILQPDGSIGRMVTNMLKVTK